MKTMKIFSVIALLMMGAFTFTSCSDDDDNNGTAYNLALMNDDAVRKAIDGTWAYTDSYTAFVFKKTDDESYDLPLLWSVRQLEDGHFEFWVGGVFRYQISFLSTTTFIITYDDGTGNEKGTVTFKRIK